MPNCNRFTIIGSRFTRFLIDEAPLASADRDNDAFSAQLEIQRIDPALSVSTFKDRKVVELGVSITADLIWESNNESKEPRKDRAFEVRFVCGIVGANPKDDGDLKAVGSMQNELVRLVYLSKRDQIASVLNDTWYGTFHLPVDLDFEPEAEAKSAKPAKKAPSRRSQASKDKPSKA